MIRELFHELSDAAFEAAREVGAAFEAAIVEAAKPKVPSTLSMLAGMRDALQYDAQVMICERFNWTGYQVYLMHDRQQTIVRVTPPCKHRFNVVLDEERMFACRGACEVFDYVMCELERAAEKHSVCKRCVDAMALRGD